MTVVSLVSALTRDELEARLYEAEETLRAIREGEIDAVVIKGGATEQVFTLEGGSQSYRTFMEAMDIGAAALIAREAGAMATDVFGQTLHYNKLDPRAFGVLVCAPAIHTAALDRLAERARELAARDGT